jgi:tyrosyl-tRNA synthetase
LSAPLNIVDLLLATELAKSKSEARRLIEGGGVRLDGEKVKSVKRIVEPGKEEILQVGKRKFVKLIT